LDRVKHLVEVIHGGQHGVESEVGVGSTFYVRLPKIGENMARTIEIEDAIWEQLCEHARQLGCDAEALAQNLLADSLQQKHAHIQQLWDEVRRLLNEMSSAQARPTVSEARSVLTPQLVDQWHALMDRLLRELNIAPESIEADITAAFDEYRRECSS
jgi:hypothetical protein